MSHGFHHLHLRKRVSKQLERYPHPNRLVRLLDYGMYVVGIAAPLAVLPQAYQLFVFKNVAGLSLTTWLLLGIMNLLWSIYGFVHKAKPIIVSNFLMGVFNFVIVYGILLYR